jgi:biopolymer transport protein TolR
MKGIMMGHGGGGDEDLDAVAEINVVPLIDVFLVLLVIFMITAPVIKTAIDMGLPEATTAQRDPSQGLTVKLMPDGTIFIDEERVSQGAFSARFRDIWAEAGAGGAERPVFLAADATVPYGDVVFVMDELRDAGVEQLGMLTRKVSRRE